MGTVTSEVFRDCQPHCFGKVFPVSLYPASACRRAPDGAGHCVLSQLAVAGLSPRELVAQKWRGQQVLMLRGVVLLGSELSRRAVLFCPALWQRLRCWKMKEKPNITRMVFKSPKEIFRLYLSAICRKNTNFSQTHA